MGGPIGKSGSGSPTTYPRSSRGRGRLSTSTARTADNRPHCCRWGFPGWYFGPYRTCQGRVQSAADGPSLRVQIGYGCCPTASKSLPYPLRYAQSSQTAGEFGFGWFSGICGWLRGRVPLAEPPASTTHAGQSALIRPLLTLTTVGNQWSRPSCSPWFPLAHGGGADEDRRSRHTRRDEPPPLRPHS